MRLDIIGINDSGEPDFSFVRDELKNLKDIPRKFDEELYEKLGVSRTVINYWREIGYKPPYYYLLWIFYDNRSLFNYKEYTVLRDALILGVCKENEKIGNALKQYAISEDEAYRNFIANDGYHMYFLHEEYDDGSEDTLMASIYYDRILDGMKHEIEVNKHSTDIDYMVSKYPMLMSEDNRKFIGINFDECCGTLRFNSDGTLSPVIPLSDCKYNYVDKRDLINPYIFIPHPFKKGDIVEFGHGNNHRYGVLSYAEDTDARLGRGHVGDGGDFKATVEEIDKAKDNEDRYVFDHTHVCPMYMELIDENSEIDYDIKEILECAGEILKGKSGSISYLSYLMDKC